MGKELLKNERGLEGGWGGAGQECCPGISQALGRELSPAGVSSGTGQSVLNCYSLSLPLAGIAGKEWLGGGGGRHSLDTSNLPAGDPQAGHQEHCPT